MQWSAPESQGLDSRSICDDGSKRIENVKQDADEHIFQKLLNRYRNCVPQSGPFIEGYIQGCASIHLHYRVFPERAIRKEELRHFCAVVKGLGKASTEATFVNRISPDDCSSPSECKTSVFVDVRQCDEKAQVVVNSGDSSAIVRLHSLDECVRIFGNPRKVAKYTVREWRRLSGPDGSPSRKHAVLIPLGGESDISPVQLDEIESQVIQSRTKLIDDLSSDDRDFFMRLRDFDCFFALRLDNDCISITSGIRGNGRFESIEVLRCPVEFDGCGTHS